jgi:hypothetical protein
LPAQLRMSIASDTGLPRARKTVSAAMQPVLAAPLARPQVRHKRSIASGRSNHS